MNHHSELRQWVSSCLQKTTTRKSKENDNDDENDDSSQDDEKSLYINSDSYVLLGGDLRQSETLDLLSKVIDPSVPTLFFSEMALIYMEPTYSDRFIRQCGRSLMNSSVLSMFVIYESIHPDDAFGRMMVTNLKNRGCDLKSIETYPTCASMVQRMKRYFLNDDDAARADNRDDGHDQDSHSFVVSYDMSTICNRILPQVDKVWLKERIRTNRLEMLDELEEYDLLMQHYAMTIAVNSYPTEFVDGDDNAGLLQGVRETWLHHLYRQHQQQKQLLMRK